MKPIFFLAAILFSIVVRSYAQTNASPVGAVAKQVQPKIMVMPRIKDDEDLKKLYDSDMNIQIALAKINESFLKRGANLVSFAPFLNQVKQNIDINKSSGNQEDYKSLVLQMSGADIYVEAKLDIVNHPSRNANSVTILLEGFQNGTSNLLGSKTGNSRMNQTSDIGLLTMQAMDSIAEGFLNLMQLKFNDIAENGQSVFVQFSLSSGATVNFDAEIGTQNKFLSEVIEDWVQAHAVKGVYNTQGVTSNKMIFSDIRIPLKNPANPQANYTGQHFYNDIIRFLRSIGLQAKREISTNNKILITIQ